VRLLDDVAAVHDKLLAGDVARTLGGGEGDERGHLFRLESRIS
jgi:hypothetical protein